MRDAVEGDFALSPTAAAAEPNHVEAFTFGDPEPVLDRRTLLGLDHMECWKNGRWYEPPVSLAGLSRARFASPHHGSAIQLKVNLLTSAFIPHPKLTRKAFGALVQDQLVLGNAYVERRDALSGRALRFERSPAKYTRRGIEEGAFFFLTHGALGGLNGEHPFEKGSVFQIMAPDIDQEIYGIPEYISALQSAFLNEAATIFRRRYYLNGSHAGFILYSTDATLGDVDVTTIRTALKESKGPGNFRNLFLHAPGGKKDGIQLIPVSEVAAKDEFVGIKNTSRDDVLAAHRTPPQLLGIVPTNAGGFGDVAKAADVFHHLEIRTLQGRFLELNEWAGEEVVRFAEYEPLSKPANDNGGAGGQRGAA